MAEVKTSKEICPKCGAQVRENTSFCYSCGADIKSRVVVLKAKEEDQVEPEKRNDSEKALEELAEKLNAKPADKQEEDRLAKAAKERRRARVSQRKVRQYMWEPRESPPWGLLFLVAAASVGLALLAIYIVLFVR
jgi:hypothetical protein